MLPNVAQIQCADVGARNKDEKCALLSVKSDLKTHLSRYDIIRLPPIHMRTLIAVSSFPHFPTTTEQLHNFVLAILHMYRLIKQPYQLHLQLIRFPIVPVDCQGPTLTHQQTRPFHTSQNRPGRRTKMSWMDSWSRPSKSQATPTPFYLIPGSEDTPYCHSCGRVISSRRTIKATDDPSAVAKYCSSRCRSHKPGKLDREIERVFVGLLNGVLEGEEKLGSPPSREKRHKAKKTGGGGKKRSKGDARILVSCDQVERRIFDPDEHHGDTAESVTSGSEHGDKEEMDVKANGNERTSAHQDTNSYHDSSPATGTMEDPTSTSLPSGGYVDGDVLARMSVRSGTRIRPPQSVSEVNGSVGGEKGRAERIEETDAMLEKRKEGMRRARHREMVRCAARRGVVFGFGSGDAKRKCEAVMLGKVVEPSFAKGDWSIRWRE